MPVIRTKTNHVVAYEAGEDDTHVQVLWLASGALHGLPHAKQFHGPLMPIEDYGEAVASATSMADAMAHQLYVVPMTQAEALGTDEVQAAVARLDHQQRGELRRLAVATVAEVMRDSDDPAVRADAHEVLVKMGVVR